MKLYIKDIMDKKNITRYQLAQLMEITYPTVDNIYKGKSTSIKFDTLEKLCRILDCTPNDILLFEDDSK